MLGHWIVDLGDHLLGTMNTALHRRGMRPQHANLCEFVTALAAGGLFASRHALLATGVLLVHGVCDYLDGGLTRVAIEESDDDAAEMRRHALVDKAGDILILGGITCSGLIPWSLGLAAMLSSVAITGVGLFALTRFRIPRARSAIDRSDRIMVLIGAALISALPLGCFAVLVLNLFGTAQRLIVVGGIALTRRRTSHG